MARAIDLAGIAVDALGIREVAGRGVEPDRFGIQSASGGIEHIE
jgi:hypothetical protein